MIISGLKNLIGTRGRVEELRDIMPTVLELAGAFPSGLDGMSLLHAGEREYLHGEHLAEYARHSNQFIVTKTDKYIWFPMTGEEQYFHLLTDPGETTNAINDCRYGDRTTYLKKLLVKELKGCPEGYSDGETLIAGCKGMACLSHATTQC